MSKIINKRLSDLRVILSTGATGIEHALYESTIFNSSISVHLCHGNQAFYIDGNEGERECHETSVREARRMIALAALSRAGIAAHDTHCLDHALLDAARLAVRSYNG